MHINSLPNDKILDWSKLKALADNKIKVTEKLKIILKIILGRVENIVGNGENAGYHPFPIMFLEGFSFKVIKNHDCVVWQRVNSQILWCQLLYKKDFMVSMLEVPILDCFSFAVFLLPPPSLFCFLSSSI